ncbi:hypothetical protein QYF61_011517 [Mycteria americana]|uniref:Uncharacterized protein n=1 Tax=Mycteria americana TaxID=33587 RepID=A0AAN7MYT4_MYCAM|nr:hypothetical protein QYF61_011517 [Mycteria americana]
MWSLELDSASVRARDPTAGPVPSCLRLLLLLRAETCQQPQWDLRLRFTPKQRFYGLNEELTLSCFMEDPPPLAVIRCAKGASPHWKDAWEVKDIEGTWHGVAENLTCTTGKSGSSRSPLLHALLPREGPRPSCRTRETAWPQLRDGPRLEAVSKMGRDRSLQCGASPVPEKDSHAFSLTEKCPKPLWRTRVLFAPSKSSYEENEELTLTCPGELKPSFPQVKCAREFLHVSSGKPVYRYAWWGRSSTGAWMRIERAVGCIAEPQARHSPSLVLCCPCKLLKRTAQAGDKRQAQKESPAQQALLRGHGMADGRVTFPLPSGAVGIAGDCCYHPCCSSSTPPAPANTRFHFCQKRAKGPDQESYKKNEEVTLSCPEGFQPSFTHVKCEGKDQPTSHGQPVYTDTWWGKDSRGVWTRIPSSVECIEKCQKPQWDPRFIFDPDRVFYDFSEEVMMKCPEGYWSSAMEIKCMKLNPREGSTIPRSGWIVRNGTGHWHPMEGNVICVGK